MSISKLEPRIRQSLRAVAEDRLKVGAAPGSTSTWVSADALASLHQLVSEPGRAADALKLLHELQVHQVELDLQFEQLEGNERELADNVARYKTLYDYAPVAYLAVGFDGQIIEGNLAAAGLFGVEQYELDGRRLDSFLAEDSAGALIGLLAKLRAGDPQASCEVRPAANGAGAWRLAANASPGGAAVLLVVCEDSR